MGVYFTFNLSYDKRQELVFQFNEEFILGLCPIKKSVQYHTMCMLLLPDNSSNNVFVYVLVLHIVTENMKMFGCSVAILFTKC